MRRHSDLMGPFLDALGIDRSASLGDVDDTGVFMRQRVHTVYLAINHLQPLVLGNDAPPLSSVSPLLFPLQPPGLDPSPDLTPPVLAQHDPVILKGVWYLLLAIWVTVLSALARVYPEYNSSIPPEHQHQVWPTDSPIYPVFVLAVNDISIAFRSPSNANELYDLFTQVKFIVSIVFMGILGHRCGNRVGFQECRLQRQSHLFPHSLDYGSALYDQGGTVRVECGRH